MVNLRPLAGAFAVMTLTGCVSRPSVDDLTANPVVATRYDTHVDFGSFDTFAVNPTISVLRDIGDAGTLSPDNAAALLQRITTNMSAHGFRSVDLAERPSLGLQATVYIQINTATATASGTWWGAPGYAGAPSYWGYPGSSYFAPWSYPTNVYKSGTLIVECVDLRDAAGSFPALDASAAGSLADAGEAGAGGKVEVVWTAYMHDLADEILTSLEPAALTAVDQAFFQSPYLQHRGTNE